MSLKVKSQICCYIALDFEVVLSCFQTPILGATFLKAGLSGGSAMFPQGYHLLPPQAHDEQTWVCGFPLSIILPDMCERNRWPRVNLSCQAWNCDFISSTASEARYMCTHLCENLTVTDRSSLTCCTAKLSSLCNLKWYNGLLAYWTSQLRNCSPKIILTYGNPLKLARNTSTRVSEYQRNGTPHLSFSFPLLQQVSFMSNSD